MARSQITLEDGTVVTRDDVADRTAWAPHASDADPRWADAIGEDPFLALDADAQADERLAMMRREIEDERHAEMATPATAHMEWHHNTGQRYGCPQDACHPPEDFEPQPEPGEGVRCAHCKERHWTVADVRLCSGREEMDAVKADIRARVTADPEPVTYATAIGYAGACEGGRCDVYNRCSKHRAQDYARGDKNAHFRAYND